MTISIPIEKAARIVREGGVIAYPTEGVFGFGCLPDAWEAVERILDIKERSVEAGLVLIAANVDQLEGWADLPPGCTDADLPSTLDNPVTWVVPASPGVPAWIRGRHASIAVRLTAHPVARALCLAAESPLVSTSANQSGRPPARNQFILRRLFGDRVDFIVPGENGGAAGASEIRDLKTGRVFRRGAA